MSRYALGLRAALHAAALAALAACTPSGTAPPPPDPGGGAALQEQSPVIPPGTAVLVERGGSWLPATVVGRVAGDRVIVHYDGYGSEWDEAVRIERLRPAAATGAAEDYRVGEKVLVTAQGKLLLADVVAQVGQRQWRVHYDGYGPEVAENVGPDRMRRPFAGATAIAPGAALLVDVGGRVLPAKVLAALAQDRWLVRFDGFGPEYDQEVTPDRLRAPAAAAPEPAPAAAAAPAAPQAPSAAGGAAGDAGKAAPGSGFQAGEAVLVAHRGVFHPASIVGPASGGRWRVRYGSAAVGTEHGVADSDEEVAADRVSRAATLEKGAAPQANQRVFVEWHGLFFPGKVTREVSKGQYRIRFDGFGPEADEVVPTKRLRPRP